jgi:hypothetical protein
MAPRAQGGRPPMGFLHALAALLRGFGRAITPVTSCDDGRRHAPGSCPQLGGSVLAIIPERACHDFLGVPDNGYRSDPRRPGRDPGSSRRATEPNDTGGEGRSADSVFLLQAAGRRRGRTCPAHRCRRTAAGSGAGLAAWRGRVVVVRHRPSRDQPTAAARHRGQPPQRPAVVRVRCDPRSADHLAGPDRHGRVLGFRNHRAGSSGGSPGGARGRYSLGLRANGRHRPGSAVGPRSWVQQWLKPRSAASRAMGSVRRTASSQGPNTWPDTAPRWVAGTTTR